MDDFLDSFSLFGVALIVLIPLVVEGIKSAWEEASGVRPAGAAAVIIVVVTSWALLGMQAVTAVWPQYAEVVRYVLAALVIPLGAMGLRGAAKSLVSK